MKKGLLYLLALFLITSFFYACNNAATTPSPAATPTLDLAGVETEIANIYATSTAVANVATAEAIVTMIGETHATETAVMFQETAVAVMTKVAQVYATQTAVVRATETFVAGQTATAIATLTPQPSPTETPEYDFYVTMNLPLPVPGKMFMFAIFQDEFGEGDPIAFYQGETGDDDYVTFPVDPYMTGYFYVVAFVDTDDSGPEEITAGDMYYSDYRDIEVPGSLEIYLEFVY
jgi:hypothetical protein